MSDDAALARRFTKATLAHDAAADDYRAVIHQRWGTRAVVTLAFTITAARIYPTVKSPWDTARPACASWSGERR